MFCILLANLRKQVKVPYNLLSVNEAFEGKRNAEIALVDAPHINTPPQEAYCLWVVLGVDG